MRRDLCLSIGILSLLCAFAALPHVPPDLARQVADSGITQITGEVVVDDRLFEPYFFRDEFFLTPAFVNDDVVDLVIEPTTVGNLASVGVRPLSSALTVVNSLLTSAPGSELDIDLNPEAPAIGLPGASVTLDGRTRIVSGQMQYEEIVAKVRFPIVQVLSQIVVQAPALPMRKIGILDREFRQRRRLSSAKGRVQSL